MNIFLHHFFKIKPRPLTKATCMAWHHWRFRMQWIFPRRKLQGLTTPTLRVKSSMDLFVIRTIRMHKDWNSTQIRLIYITWNIFVYLFVSFWVHPKCSMYGIYTYIYHKFRWKVGTSTSPMKHFFGSSVLQLPDLSNSFQFGPWRSIFFSLCWFRKNKKLT